MKNGRDNLTIIIPSHNEGKEVENTLASIRQTAGNEVNVMLVDDASDDGVCYRDVCNKFNSLYYRNDVRMGPARSRDLGVDMTGTPFFMTVDSHMRFYHNDWWKRITDVVASNPEALYCANCKALDMHAEPMANKPHFGAFVDFMGEIEGKVLSPLWMRKDHFPTQDLVEIPCILGATYASSKRYWQHLKGLNGLNQYGHEEPYISIKAWMDGGKCHLIKDVEIGHLFRETFPYKVNVGYYVYNKLVIMETLLPDDMKNELYNALRRQYGEHLREAMEIMIDNQAQLQSLHDYYQNTFKYGFEVFQQINSEYMRLNNNL